MATFELAEAHKDFLAKYYDEYGRTSQRAAVRKRASRDLIAQFGITKKEHTDQVEKLVTSWLYEKVLRDRATTSAGRFGVKINTKPRELWAIDHADTIDKEVAALLVPHPVDEHVWRRVGIRSSVLAEKWKNVPPEEQQKFVMLKQAFEEGTASVEDQAKHGDKYFMKFVNSVLKEADRQFGAHLVIVSARPTTQGQLAFKCRETPTPDQSTKPFLESVSTWDWSPRDFSNWKRGVSRASGDSDSDWVLYDPQTFEPVIPPYEGCGIMSKRSLLGSYMNAHFTLARGRSKGRGSPWKAMERSPHEFVDARFLPSYEGFVVNQAKNMKAQHVNDWLKILWDQQELFKATGDIQHRFRIKADYRAPSIVPVTYDIDWMRTNAMRVNKFYGAQNLRAVPVNVRSHSEARQNSDTEMGKKTQSSDEDDGQEEDDPLEDSATDNPSDHEDDDAPATTTRSDEDVDDGPSGPAGNRLVEQGEETNTPRAKTMSRRILVGSPTPRASSSRYSSSSGGPLLHSPAPPPPRSPSDSGSDPEDSDADPFAVLFRGPTTKKSTISIDDPPSSANDNIELRMEYLKLLWSNATYQKLVELHAADQSSIETIVVDEMPWISWTSNDSTLPMELHRSNDMLKKATDYISKLQKSIRPPTIDSMKLETLLLMVGLLAREVNRLHFPHDVDSAPYTLAVDADDSTLTPVVHAAMEAVLGKLLKTISVKSDRLVIASRPVVPPLLLPATKAKAKSQSRPKPRPRGSAVRVVEDSETSSREHSVDSEGDGSGALRKSRRQPVPTRRYEDYESGAPRKPRSTTASSEDEPLANATHKKGKGIARSIHK